MLTPSSNTTLEPLTSRMAAAAEGAVDVHFSRFRVTAITTDVAGRAQFAPAPMMEAARLLADARVDVIVWNGTSGGWEGVDADRRLVRTIEEELGTPATTGTLATLDALRALGVRRYGLVVPYVEEIAAAIRRTFAGEGFECAGWTAEGLTTNWDFATVAPSRIADRCRSLAPADPDAIAVFCTNLPGAPAVEEVERDLGIPVLDSVATCLWGALRTAGAPTTVPGWGRLLAMAPDLR
jgi:maleate isomerase